MATRALNTCLQLRLLHVTDVHASFENIQRLKTWLDENKRRLDVVLLSGDMANIAMEVQLTSTEEELAKHHQDLTRVVEQFVPLAKQVFYIPGNHDVITTYVTDSSVSSPCNVHLRQVGVAPGLHILGAGGSIPGFRNGKKHWGSFPYVSDKEFAKDLTKVLDPFFFPEESLSSPLGENDAVILMTHNGPDQSSTTVARAIPTNPITSGSAALYEYICKEHLQQHVIMNIHGHTHDASGSATVGKTTVINPGALVEERFGIYTLTSDANASPSWRLTSVELFRLPS